MSTFDMEVIFLSTKNRQGFTLIEMMVVIAIIGILVAIVYASFSDARKQSRDKTRQIQLEELRVALALYKDKHGRYPERGCNPDQNSAVVWAGPKNDAPWSVVCDEYIVGLVPDFMEALPRDPGSTTTSGSGIYYRTNPTGSLYSVIYNQNVEALFVADKGAPYARYAGTSCVSSPAHQNNTYAVYSLGAECL